MRIIRAILACPGISREAKMCRNIFFVSLWVLLLFSAGVSYSYQMNILVDASRDGGAWWFPQGPAFDSNKPHQGKALADYMRALGYVVTELPRSTTIVITPDMLASYDIVIRANEYGAYSDSEIQAYHDFVSNGGGLLLLGDYVRPNEVDSLALSFGIRLQGTTRGENRVTVFESHPITSGVSSMRYGVGSGITESPESANLLGYVSVGTYLDLNGNGRKDAGEPTGVPVLGETTFGSGKIVFCGDTNMWNAVPQPLVDNTIRWLYESSSGVPPARSRVDISFLHPVDGIDEPGSRDFTREGTKAHSYSLLDGRAEVSAYQNGSDALLYWRMERGLGVNSDGANEIDEVDVINCVERLEVRATSGWLLEVNSFQLRSIFTEKGYTEQGIAEFYLGNVLRSSVRLFGKDDGIADCSFGTSPVRSDRIVFRVPDGFTGSNFAVAGLSVDISEYDGDVDIDQGVPDVPVSGTIHVSVAGDDSVGNGSMEAPYGTIQKGIDAASDGDIVIVADGVYEGAGNTNLDLGGKAVILKSENGAESCVIDCMSMQDTRGLHFHSGEGPDTILDGFTITHGNADNGGGILCENSSAPTIVNSRIVGNRAEEKGGGIQCYSSSPRIANNEIMENSAKIGAGVSCDDSSSPVIENNVFAKNSGEESGGGINCSSSSAPIIAGNTLKANSADFGGGISSRNAFPQITCNFIRENRAEANSGDRGGGGIYCDGPASPEIANNVISRNQSVIPGGGIFCLSASPGIINNTIIENSSAGMGGGIYCRENANPTVSNTILWDDKPQEIAIESDSVIEVSYSDVQGGLQNVVKLGTLLWLDGNIDADPMLTMEHKDDYRLSDSSPCIGAGSMASYVPTSDIEGNPRPNPPGSRPDIGAYENKRALSLGIFTRIDIPESNIVSHPCGRRCGSWGDYDGDGYADLFTSNRHLYRNNGDGTLTQVMDSGIGEATDEGGIWIDYNNDGRLDLFVRNENGANSLFTNQGDGTFVGVGTGSIVEDEENSWGAAWADYDNDGDVDLFVANHTNDSGITNSLYSNNGDGAFTKITTGIIAAGDGNSEGCAWGDYDNDGYTDLFVSNYGMDNFLYHNNGDGTFTLINGAEVVRDKWSTGCAWGDYNNDGYLDLSVINLVENSLHTNNGDGTFTRVTTGDIVSEYSSSRGCAWGDYDNDGDLDLVVTNGHPLYGNNLFYSNNGDGTFTKVATGVVADLKGVTGGPCWADCDNDGDLDLVNTSKPDSYLFVNNGNGKNWINVRCIGTVSNSAAIGAKVRVEATINGSVKWQMREVSTQTGSGQQDSLEAEFGLGDATVVDIIRIEWPSGIVQELANVAVNQFLTVTEGSPEPEGPPEEPAPEAIYVSTSGDDATGDGSKDKPYQTIQMGIDKASDGDVVLVMDGVYKGTGNVNLDIGGKAITVRSENGAANCIVDCENKRDTRGFSFRSGEGPDSVVDGFTIRNGKGVGNSLDGWGGGIYCENSSPRIINNIITGNLSYWAGGILCVSSSPMIINNVIAGNSANWGGGILCKDSSPTIINNTITENVAAHGGAFFCLSSSPEIINTILWNNRPQEIYFGTGSSPSQVSVSYSDVRGGQAGIDGFGVVNWGDGNIDVDPAFADAASGNYHLSDSSLCIGAGTSGGAPLTDTEGKNRGTPADIGAYENNLDEPLLPDEPNQTRALASYPNPFNPETWIPYQLREDACVAIRIYTATGKLVRTLELGYKPSGFYIDRGKAAYWDGRNEWGEHVASGVYFYNLKAGDFVTSGKMVMLK